MIGLER